jgi:diguanylate cyclase (GGDEF)-like protein
LLIDLQERESPGVIVARPDDQFIADVVAADLDSEKWRPWEGVPAGATPSLDVNSFPDRMRSLMNAQGWNRSIVAPVYVHDRLTAVFMLVGGVPKNYDPLSLKRNVAARIQGLVRVAAMLIEHWGDQDRLRVAASTDELTGLFNRRELFARLEIDRRAGSLLYIDVDDFKYINDRYGHAVGDEVLVHLARRIESECRTQDSIARVGGDEFVIVLPGADEAFALRIARRIIDRVAEPLQLESGPTVSVSIGCALLDVDDPIDAADHAMLRAKRRGRGLVAASSTA